jgi:TolB-like protein
MYFENQGNPELDMLKLGLAQMIIHDLSQISGLQVVERVRLNDVMGELALQKTADVDPDTAARMGKLLGAERVVVGYYFELMGRFTVLARVVEVESGKVLGASEAAGKVEEFAELEGRIVEELLPHLGAVAAVTPGEAPGPEGPGKAGKSSKSGQSGQKKSEDADRVRGGAGRPGSSAESAAQPSDESYEQSVASGEALGSGGAGSAGDADTASAAPRDSLGAALAFSEGLDYLDRKDLVRAREALQRAVDLDPSLSDARSELARLQI